MLKVRTVTDSHIPEQEGSQAMAEDQEITLNPVLVAKIQNYMNDPIYRETIENAAAFNSRLAGDRTQRLPFLDSQTGVAQNHSSLWMEPRHRLPGFEEGQVYSYPSKRWRKKRRQYLSNFMQPRYPPGIPRKDPGDDNEPPVITESVHVSTPGTSTAEEPHPHPHPREVATKEEIKPPEAWYYDDLDMPDPGDFDEPDADSDYDYEESYNKKKKKKATPKATRQTSTRGRRKITYDAITDPEKPFSCDICGARYKTRPGLTYHYTHSHKDKEDEEEEDVGKRDDSGQYGRTKFYSF